MKTLDTIIITGAAGFIGSYLAGYLNSLDFTRLVLVDDFDKYQKSQNLKGKTFIQQVNREKFFEWFKEHGREVACVFHLGARTDSTEMNYEVHRILNFEYSKQIWNLCCEHGLPLVYASSAATYGSGNHGFKDDHRIVSDLIPLNAYGLSKNNFDIWVLQQEKQPPFWAGTKFFNVYGPNEYHKERMASVILHAYRQIKMSGTARLFRSHDRRYKDGEQLRDFIYVKDVVAICTWLMKYQPISGIYNGGTGKARTFVDLVSAIFDTLKMPVNIQFDDMPTDIRDKYQYFTEAEMTKLIAAGYPSSFYSLEEGVREYVRNYLETEKVY